MKTVWTDKHSDLDLMRLVHCEKISPYENDDPQLKSDKSAGLFQVHCLEVIDLTQIPQRFPLNEKSITIDLDANLGEGSRSPKISIFKRPKITFYTGATEGHFWCVIATNTEPRRLILSGHILVGKHEWEICNRPFVLIGDEERIIKQMAAEA